MLTLDLTDEQIIALLEQLPETRRARVINRFAVARNAPADPESPAPPKRQPVFGEGRDVMRYIAPDFDEPLDDMKEYMY